MKKARIHTEITEDHGEPRTQCGSHDKAPQAIFQAEHIEVHQQTHLVPGQAEVRRKLRLVDRMNDVDSFDFENHRVREDDIGREAGIELRVALDNRKFHVPLEIDASLGEFKAKAFPVDRFQKPRPEPPADLDRQPDHAFGQFAAHQHKTPLSGSPWFPVFSVCNLNNR